MSKQEISLFETDRKKVILEQRNYNDHYRILDIGGGGEGVISSLYKHRVIAVDIRQDELEEVTEKSSLKIVMDATHLQFIDEQFDHVTAFFSFMYMDETTKEKAISEIYRVLKKDGIIEIWDVEIPPKSVIGRDIIVIQLEVMAEDFHTTPGYGIASPIVHQGMNNLLKILIDHGFFIKYKVRYENDTYYIEAMK